MCLDLGAATILHPRFENLEADQQQSRENWWEKHLCRNAGNTEQPGILIHIEWYPTNRIGFEETGPQVMDEPQRCSD